MRPVLIWLLVYSCAAVAAERVTLREAVSQALARNPDLAAAKADIAIAEAKMVTARLRPNPVLSFTGDHLDILGTGFNDVNGGGPAEIAAGFEYTVLRGGKRVRRMDVARQTRDVTEFRYRDSSRSLVLGVENAFIDALLTRETIELDRQNLGFFRQIVTIDEARWKSGDIAEVEFVRSRLAALQYEAAVRQAEQRHREALLKLQTLMGRGRSLPDFDVDGSLDRSAPVPPLETLREQAFDSRPDLLALRRDAGRAASSVALERANAKQDWTLGTEYRRQQENARANALTVGFSVPLPVFDRNQGEIARAEQERKQAEIRVTALEQQISGEVETAWWAATSARGLLETIQGAMLESARSVRDITEYSYRRGDASLLALLDAQRAFNDTMQAYIEARAEYARSLYELDNVCGKVDLP